MFLLFQIIGDKKGGKTTLLLHRSTKYWSLLQEIQEKVHIPIKFIHTIRNPFDNIATMLLRRHFGNNLNWTEIYKKPVSEKPSVMGTQPSLVPRRKVLFTLICSKKT